MEAFWSLALLQLLELPDHLNGSKIAEGQGDKPEAAIDARSSDQWCWDGLDTETQAYSRRLNASQQRAVPDLIARGITEIRNAPVPQYVISSRSGSIWKPTSLEDLPINVVLDLGTRRHKSANNLTINLESKRIMVLPY